MFRDIYRTHDEFPELKECSNLSLTLHGKGSNLPQNKEPSSITEFGSYSMQIAVGRSFQEPPWAESQSTSVAKREQTQKEGVSAITNPISFDLKLGQSLEEREAARELLCRFTRDFLAALLAKSKTKVTERKVPINLIKKYLSELERVGVYRIYTQDGLIDLRDNHTFKIS